MAHKDIKMGLSIYNQSLLKTLQQNRKLGKCFYTTKHTLCVKISETLGNLYTADTSKQRTLDVRPKLTVIWGFHCSFLLKVFKNCTTKEKSLNRKKNL